MTNSELKPIAYIAHILVEGKMKFISVEEYNLLDKSIQDRFWALFTAEEISNLFSIKEVERLCSQAYLDGGAKDGNLKEGGGQYKFEDWKKENLTFDLKFHVHIPQSTDAVKKHEVTEPIKGKYKNGWDHWFITRDNNGKIKW